jgi:hypothetical protein
MLSQVFDRLAQRIHVIDRMPQQQIAVLAQETANLAGSMAVVHVNHVSLGVAELLAANEASITLSSPHGFAGFGGQSVLRFEPGPENALARARPACFAQACRDPTISRIEFFVERLVLAAFNALHSPEFVGQTLKRNRPPRFAYLAVSPEPVAVLVAMSATHSQVGAAINDTRLSASASLAAGNAVLHLFPNLNPLNQRRST